MKRVGFLALLMGFLMSFTNPTGYKVGDKATDFKLKSVDNKMYSMADYKDAKGFIVVFTCNHCPFAVKYEDRIIDLAKKYKSKGYILLAINPNDPAAQPEDSFELMQERAKEKKFSFPYLFDEGQKIYPQYGATKTPHVFLLDKNLVVKYIGSIDDNVEDAAQVKEKYLENAIAALENGEEPTPNTTKAIGCSIKVKK
ncbi:thioredoxin family protein [Flavobacterium sp. N2820]|uniref:thioredoxin family protein n=1 Tax=Flavobacterium sp. N2820 TaxID=2986834 RepID=UPI0022243F8C|nr:thioredoxin family protein [Flavobacterium sp. N2820]